MASTVPLGKNLRGDKPVGQGHCFYKGPSSTKVRNEANEGTGTQVPGKRGCIGPQARVKSSDFLLSAQGRIYIGFTCLKDQLLTEWAWPVAVSTESELSWRRTWAKLVRVDDELGQRRRIAREDARLKAEMIE